jgi:hypothetical protein
LSKVVRRKSKICREENDRSKTIGETCFQFQPPGATSFLSHPNIVSEKGLAGNLPFKIVHRELAIVPLFSSLEEGIGKCILGNEDRNSFKSCNKRQKVADLLFVNQ